jgi:hypothetical protein
MVYESQISCQEHNHSQQVTKELVELYLYRYNERVRNASILQGKVGRFRGRYEDD